MSETYFNNQTAKGRYVCALGWESMMASQRTGWYSYTVCPQSDVPRRYESDSLAKTVTALAAGAAVHRGLFDIDTPLVRRITNVLRPLHLPPARNVHRVDDVAVVSLTAHVDVYLIIIEPRDYES